MVLALIVGCASVALCSVSDDLCLGIEVVVLLFGCVCASFVWWLRLVVAVLGCCVFGGCCVVVLRFRWMPCG